MGNASASQVNVRSFKVIDPLDTAYQYLFLLVAKMTQWTGEAWRKLSSDKMFAKKLFMKTGCLMTADVSDDDMIKPQGLELYSF